MMTKEDLLDYVQVRKDKGEFYDPIYFIMAFENPNKEIIYPSGKKSGFPDIGAECDCGFYYDLGDAIKAVESNNCDMREYVYNAAFILCKFPGMYESSGPESRMYFIWDDESKEYKLADEPEIFKHIAY